MNLTKKETPKMPAKIRTPPVRKSKHGIKIKPCSEICPLPSIMPRLANIPKSKTAVAFVGPNVINLLPPNIPPSNEAKPDPMTP